MQTTVSGEVEFAGTGLHSGKPVSMRIRPADADTGIVITRTDIKSQDNRVPVRLEFVRGTELCTQVANDAGISVSTVEHGMAGLAACGVHNAEIEVDGDEFPALDGSARDFVLGILSAGVRPLGKPVRIIEILKPVHICVDGARASLEPSGSAQMSFEILFPAPIGEQRRFLDLSNGAIVRKLADCRTFVLSERISDLRSKGFGLGGDENNVVIADVGNNRFVRELRQPDEPCGHKMLDAVGDLSLAGHPIIGKFTGKRSGHGTTVALLRKLLADKDAYRIRVADRETAAGLPGAGAVLQDIAAI